MSKLTSKRVTEVFNDCMFKDGENHDDHIKVEGLRFFFGMHPGRVAQHKDEIAQMLNELPAQFKAGGGGGWSFLNACEDWRGNLWTGDQAVVEQLVTLGIAAGKASYVLPRETWASFPGGVPYFVVNE